MPALDMTLDELLEEFEHLPDWADRCDFLIDLGMELPKLDASEKVEANRVVGCQSSVWMVADEDRDGAEPRLNIRAESDSMFVSGLIAILLLLFDGKTPGEILESDPDALFERLDLQRHLSSQRRNGLKGMVLRIRSLAARAAMRTM
ncbi:MAG TPA: SufE family protein [Caulifigura sp.]|jgi:cysteine desulfuration protein SufE|nr:SufE family protein [Caulifigura sp.]